MPTGGDNRYHVDPLDGPAALAEALRRLEQRIAALEGSPLVGSNLTAYDSAKGEELVVVGNLGDGTSGILVKSASGQTLFRVDTVAGQTAPQVNPVPVYATTALLSGSVNGFRPGTASATMAPIWAHEWWTVGDRVDYDIECYANAGVMEWRITVAEVGAAKVTVVGPVTETTNVQRAGTFTIPATALVSGTDVAGRLMRMDFEARKVSGAPVTVDISLNQAPRNYGG